MVRPSCSPCSTVPVSSCDLPRTQAASRTRLCARSQRASDEEAVTIDWSVRVTLTGQRISVLMPRSSQILARSSGVPARRLPKWKSQPSTMIAGLYSSMTSSRNDSGSLARSSGVGTSSMTSSAPAAIKRSRRIWKGSIREGAFSGLRMVMGWGWKLSTITLPAPPTRSLARSMSIWCPRWTPS